MNVEMKALGAVNAVKDNLTAPSPAAPPAAITGGGSPAPVVQEERAPAQGKN